MVLPGLPDWQFIGLRENISLFFIFGSLQQKNLFFLDNVQSLPGKRNSTELCEEKLHSLLL